MDELLLNAGIQDPVKRAKCGDTMKDLMQGMALEAVQKSDQAWEARLPQLVQTVKREVFSELGPKLASRDAEIDRKFNDIQDQLEKSGSMNDSVVQKELGEVRSEIKELRTAVNKQSPQSSMSTSQPARKQTASGAVSSGSEWQPSKIEIKGFVTDEAWRPGNEDLRDKQSKSKQECMDFAKRILSALPQHIATMLNVAPLEKYSSAYVYSRVDLHFTQNLDFALKKEVLDAVSQVLVKPDFLHEDRSLRASLELSPDRKTTSKVMGRAFGSLRQLGAENSKMTAAYNPLSIKCISGGRPNTVATLRDGVWKVDTKGRELLLPNLTDDAVRDALAQSS